MNPVVARYKLRDLLKREERMLFFRPSIGARIRRFLRRVTFGIL